MNEWLNVWVQLQSTLGILYRSVMQPLHDVMIGCCSRALFCDVDIAPCIILLVQQPNQIHQQYELCSTTRDWTRDVREWLWVFPNPNPSHSQSRLHILFMHRLTRIRISIAAHLCENKKSPAIVLTTQIKRYKRIQQTPNWSWTSNCHVLLIDKN